MSFVRSIVRLGSANVVLLAAQSATIIGLGVIGDPAGMGIYFLAQTTAQFVATFSTMRLDSAFPAASGKPELNSLLILALGAMTAMMIPQIFTMLSLRAFGLFEFQTLTLWHVAGIALLTAVVGLQQLGRYWAIRHGHLKAIEQATYLRALAIAFLRGGALLGVAVGGLKGVALGGVLLGVEILLYLPTALSLFPRPGRTDTREAARLKNLKAAARRNWTFPVIETPSTLVDSGTQNAPIYLVTQLFGLTATASFGLAYRAMAVPVGQLALAITEAMQSRYAGWLHEGRFAEMSRMFNRSSALFAALGAAGCLLAWLLLETMVVAVVGEKMREFARIATVLTPWIACNVLVNTNSRLIPLLKRQDLKLAYDFTSASLLVGAWLVQRWLKLDLVGFVMVLSLGQATAYVLYWLLIRHALKQAARRWTPGKAVPTEPAA